MPALAETNALDVEARTARALIEYKNGNIGKSSDIYKEIYSYLNQVKVDNLSKFLPTAPEGWAEIPVEGKVSKTTKNFSKENAAVKLSFISDSRLMDAINILMSMASTMPEGGDETKKPIKDYAGFLYKFEKNEKSGANELQFFVSDRLMVEVVGVMDEATAMLFIKKLDLPALKAESSK